MWKVVDSVLLIGLLFFVVFWGVLVTHLLYILIHAFQDSLISLQIPISQIRFKYV